MQFGNSKPCCVTSAFLLFIVACVVGVYGDEYVYVTKHIDVPVDHFR